MLTSQSPKYILMKMSFSALEVTLVSLKEDTDFCVPYWYTFSFENSQATTLIMFMQNQACFIASNMAVIYQSVICILGC